MLTITVGPHTFGHHSKQSVILVLADGGVTAKLAVNDAGEVDYLVNQLELASAELRRRQKQSATPAAT